MKDRPIRTLIVDDSALVRRIMQDILAPFPEIEVVGTAADPYAARDQILALEPDVMTLDIEMPRMDGLTFLKVIMEHRPMPVIVISSLTQRGSQVALQALQLGAVDVVGKPQGTHTAVSDGAKLAAMIQAAARARIHPRVNIEAPTAPSRPGTVHSPREFDPRSLILIGASTGGTEALARIFSALPPHLPGIAVVQHIPPYFSRPFSERLNSLSAVKVQQAESGDRILPGTALVAPGGHHLLVRWTNSGYMAVLNDGPLMHHQRPAVDVLFDSALRTGNGSHLVGVLLTGMGSDGALGMCRMRASGATTIAQDEATCVVFGMPREAIRQGGAQLVLPLHQIAESISRIATSPGPTSRQPKPA